MKKDQSKHAKVKVTAAKNSTSKQKKSELAQLKSLCQELQTKLTAAEEKEKRTLADYQNLIRRNREERAALIKMANKDLLSGLLQALDNLSRASQEIDNPGLNMVIKQFWQSLKEFGLEEIEVMDQEFDVDTMEVVDKKDKAKKVIAVVSKGYKLNGEVIQHAKVILD
ncbi:MAG: nucleotide exchange factor GrpE [Candidatus Woesebacteria bacterium]|jgi:molecular chaperone GrpE